MYTITPACLADTNSTTESHLVTDVYNKSNNVVIHKQDARRYVEDEPRASDAKAEEFHRSKGLREHKYHSSVSSGS